MLSLRFSLKAFKLLLCALIGLAHEESRRWRPLFRGSVDEKTVNRTSFLCHQDNTATLKMTSRCQESFRTFSSAHISKQSSTNTYRRCSLRREREQSYPMENDSFSHVVCTLILKHELSKYFILSKYDVMACVPWKNATTVKSAKVTWMQCTGQSTSFLKWTCMSTPTTRTSS